ncbi:MAG TPA: hypothetical protein VGQ77_05975 [Methylomirabilota bacterium]|jgi:hypothetical protein|nr:hypothetical protein [Methylomirabilota bacterium]
MIGRVGLAVCALVLLAVTGVAAQQYVTGTVVRIDQPAHVVILDNGQMYRATPSTVFLVNDQRTHFAAIQPGTRVAFHSAQPVFYRDGQYLVMTQPAPVVAVPSSGVFEVSGVVRWVGASEPGRSSLTLDDGRHIWIDEHTQVLANGAPVMISTLRPGTFVVIRSTKPLAFRNNTYYTTSSSVVTAPAPVVVTPTTVVTSPALHVVTGTVVRFDQPNMIVLSDGRVIPATTQTVVMVDNRPVPFTTLQPGSQVVIYPQGHAAFVSDPYAFPGPWYPELGLREKELERNSP